MKHEVTIRLVKKQGFFNETFRIDAKNGDQAAIAGENIAAALFDKDKDIISYSIVGIHPVGGELPAKKPAPKEAVKKTAKKPVKKKKAATTEKETIT